jgi:hypothetical protein
MLGGQYHEILGFHHVRYCVTKANKTKLLLFVALFSYGYQRIRITPCCVLTVNFFDYFHESCDFG